MENTLSNAEKARVPTPSTVAMMNMLFGGSMPLFLGQPVLADVDRIVTTVAWPTGALTATIAAQPACPCNVTATLTDTDNSCTGTLTITGLDCSNNVVTETMSPDGLGGGKTLVGTKIFAKITSVTVANGAGSTPDNFTVGVGSVIGIPFDLVSTSGIWDVYLGGVRIASPVLTAGVSTSGVNASSGTYDGSKILQVFINLMACIV